jgi:short-subunit dehydrogenase
MKTVAIVGAGPGLGLSLANTFGQHDFRVALLARDQEKLDTYVQQLRDMHVEAAGFSADVLHTAQLEAALARVKETVGPVDVLEYSPTPSITDVASVLDVTPENAQFQFDYIVRGALAAVRTVLPDMLDNGDGGLIFTVGGSAITPVPMMGNVGIAMAGLRNYVANLHEVLKSKGIYAGTMVITGWFKSTDPTPGRIAASIYEMYEKREQGERVFEV